MKSNRFRAAALGLSLILLAACGAGGGGGGDGGGGSGAPVTATVSLLGVRDHGIVHSGVLMFSMAGPWVPTVEVSLDGGAYQAATPDNSLWKLTLPTGAATWRDGTAHTIAARAKDAAGAAGSVTTVTVRKGVNHDTVGSGREALAVGAIGHGSYTGRVYVYQPGPNGVAAAGAGSATNTLDGVAASDQFGMSIALGDVNGDGFADMIVGAPMAGSNSGKVYVFHSHGSSGVTGGTGATPAADEADAALLGAVGGDLFGISVAAADVNGDGFCDVIASAVQAGSGVGYVYVFHSEGSTGITSSASPISAAVIADSMLQGESGQMIGRMVAAGDVNGDGRADLVVGTTSGAPLYVFHSRGSTGVTETSALTLAAAEADSQIEPSMCTIGFAVAVGDINGDGYGDVVATDPWCGTWPGRGDVFVFHSRGATGITADSTPVDAINESEAWFEGEGAFDSLGYSVAVADVNGDGYGDVVASSFTHPGELEVNPGRVYLFHSAGPIGLGVSAAANADSKIDGESDGNAFGQVVSTADLNGDGYADVIAAAPFYDAEAVTDAGRVYVFHSRGAGGVTADDSAVVASGEAETAITGELINNDQFGNGIAGSGPMWD